MNPDQSRFLGRLNSFSPELGVPEMGNAQDTILRLAKSFIAVEDLPPFLRPLFEAHREEIMAGLDIPEHRP
jgi:hypothetical protein